jgi:tetratricopeptide (TPR) repeat protein
VTILLSEINLKNTTLEWIYLFALIGGLILWISPVSAFVMGDATTDEESLATCNQVLKTDPNNPNAWLHKGQVLVKMGRYQEALVAYEEVIEHSPTAYGISNGWVNKGNTLEWLNRNSEAIKAYDKALSIYPKNTDAQKKKDSLLIRFPKSSTGSLSVTSYPSGVSVYVDENYQGTTPIILQKQTVGSHKIKLVKPGYYDYSFSAIVNAGETEKVSGSLTEIMTTKPTTVPRTLSQQQIINTPIQNQQPSNKEMGLAWDYQFDSDVYLSRIAISPDNSVVAASTTFQGNRGSQTSKTNIFDKSGKLKWSYDTPSTVSSIAISRDNSLIVIGSGVDYSYSKTPMVFFIDSRGQKNNRYITREEGVPESIAISKDGNYVTVGTFDGSIYLFDRSGKILWENNYYGRFDDVGIAPDGSLVFGVNFDKLYVYDKSGKLLWTHDVDIYCDTVGISKNNQIIVGVNDGQIIALNPKGELLWSTNLKKSIQTFAVSDNGDYIIAATSQSKVFLINSDGKILWDYQFDNENNISMGSIRDVGISADGSLMAVELLDEETWQPNYRGIPSIPENLFVLNQEGKIIDSKIIDNKLFDPFSMADDGTMVAISKDRSLKYYSPANNFLLRVMSLFCIFGICN